MVGRPSSSKGKPRASNGDSPPPYFPPVYVAETRTTEVVTTTTTTQLFSLPLLRRKPSHDVFGIAHREKELPQVPDPLPPSFSTTSALALASIGLSLPHSSPQLTPRNSSEVNTVSFGGDSPPSTSLHPRGLLHRPGQRARAASSIVTEAQAARRRSRGLSLNASALLSLGPSDPKGKGKQTEYTESPEPSPKLLSRKPSFWSRKKANASSQELSEPEHPLPSEKLLHPLPLPQLPTFQPSSPFEVDIVSDNSPATPSSSTHHRRGLSRSHSERAGSSTFVPFPERSSTLLSPGGQPRFHTPPHAQAMRPATADAAHPPHNHNHFQQQPPSPSSPPMPTRVHARRRSMTNPPLLQRLSMGLFSSNASSSSGSSPINSTPPPLPTTPVSLHASPRPSFVNPSTAPAAPRPSSSKAPGPPSANESPEVYLQRILMTVSKAEITTILASRTDKFHADALRGYIRQFDFVDDPLDIAVRKLLLDVSLPRETQQIDRVIEAFAARYTECNQNLYISNDHPYILAFSLIMLHTDAFNKSNKRKMSKADYIKNTRLPGIAPEVLECFFDNTVFAPFIFIEDPLDVNGQPSDGFVRTLNHPVSSAGPPPSSSSSILGMAPKLDPYYLITHGQLNTLRVNVNSIIPPSNPFTYKGTDEELNEEELHRAFTKATILEVGAMDPTNTHTSYSLGVVGVPPSPLTATMSTFQDAPALKGEIHSLRVTKVGVLNRKDDILPGGKKSTSRKWRTWGVILTGSQLLFFRDPTWVSALMTRWAETDGQVIVPQATVLRPDELFTVKDSIAVYDNSYVRYQHTLRFVMPDNRHILLQAPNDSDLNEWITRINYASAFRSAGVRMRSLAMSGEDVELTGVAAASSHLHDLQHLEQPEVPAVHNWGQDAPNQLMGMLSGSGHAPSASKKPRRRYTVMSGTSNMDLEVPSAPEVDGADQFKATFDQVKSELAAGHLATPSEDDDGLESYPSSTTDSLPLAPSALRTRAQIIQSKLADISAKASAANTQLESDMRFVRNVALLAPFQRATRDRLFVAVQNIAPRITQVRLELTKYACHREVLVSDLVAERREWRHASRVALRRATDMLTTEAEKRDRRRYPPTMTISTLDPDPLEPAHRPSDATSPSRLETPRTHQSESSISESFHSALDFPDWDNSELVLPAYLSPMVDVSPHPSSHDSGSSYFPDNQLSSVPEQDGGIRDTSSHGHQKFSTALESGGSRQQEDLEVAEEWNKTRCAQRVSLVRLPSHMDINATWGRAQAQGLQPDSNP